MIVLSATEPQVKNNTDCTCISTGAAKAYLPLQYAGSGAILSPCTGYNRVG